LSRKLCTNRPRRDGRRLAGPELLAAGRVGVCGHARRCGTSNAGEGAANSSGLTGQLVEDEEL
jgi:hypothetical protein